MALCARICEPMRLSTLFRSLWSLYLQQLRSSFMSNDFRVWKEVYSIKGSVWTKSMWNKILTQPCVACIYFLSSHIPYLCSLFITPSLWSSDFLGKSYFLSIPYKALLLPGSVTRTCVTSASPCLLREMASPFLFISSAVFNCGTPPPLLQSSTLRVDLWKPASLVDIAAVEVAGVHKQTKLYWRLLRKIKRKT